MSSNKLKILVATTNPGKMAELAALLGDLAERICWKTLADFADLPAVIEDGSTFARNAQKKALGYARATGLLTIADDSGLVIDALGGQPGVRSARFADEMRKNNNRKQIDRENYQKVLAMMKDIPEGKRTARFVCHLCLADEKQVLLQAEGTLEGNIAEQPMGDNGFGYDPIFWIPSLKKTVAQLDAEQKNRISHRADAAGKFKTIFRDFLQRTVI
jgi:non-canonical purine NTP pyrophosphatase (RdgB/HAM1 family)